VVLDPLHNPIGFGGADFAELALAVALCVLTVFGSRIEPAVRWFAKRTVWCMVLLALLPVALRLALLAHHPVPTPDVYDEFGHLLVADTLRHFRLANPPHPLPQFFETFFVLQQPAYASIYPLGQGMMLALGRAVSSVPWTGVVLATGALCALVYWMLRAWVTPVWALLGGLLAVVEFGPLSQWMNDYWGGSLAACAGCLVFGSLPRRNWVCLGIGLAIHWLTRPYESIFLFAAVALFGLPRKSWIAALVFLPALGLTLWQNQQVTGSWFTLPYQLSQQQYGVPASLTFQANPTPHRELTPQQELGYRMQVSAHGESESPWRYLVRLWYRSRFYSFFLLVPLYPAALAFLVQARRDWWVLATIAIFVLGENFYPYFQPHYIAALTSLFVLICVVGLQTIFRWSPLAARFLVLLCAGQFAYYYGSHALETEPHGPPSRRAAVNTALAAVPGRQLVFVRYWPNHIFQDEWVYNDAAIDESRIVYARDLGPQENEKLRQYYAAWTVWLLEPDAQPPALTVYQSVNPAAVVNEPVQAKPAEPEPDKPKPKPLQPKLRFEDVK
jgi:hypothetical protein